MFQNMLIAINAILPSFITIGLGMFARRKGMVGENELKKFNTVAFRIFLACQLFKNVYDSSLGESFSGKLALFLFIAILCAAGLGFLIAHFFEPQLNRRGVMIQGIFRSNFILLGLPLVTSVFGPECGGLVSLMTAIVVPTFNLLAVVVLELYAGGTPSFKKTLRQIVTNPLICATLLAVVIKLLGIDLYRASFFKNALSSIAGAATPLCLFILGGSFVPASIRSYARSLWITVTTKLLILPALSILAAVAMGFRGVELGVIMICFGAPTAVSSYNMTREIGGDEELAAGIVVVDTALSALTLFFWIFLLKQLALI